MCHVSIADVPESPFVVEHASIPTCEKTFIESVIRNTSIAIQSRDKGSDDESDAEIDKEMYVGNQMLLTVKVMMTILVN